MPLYYPNVPWNYTAQTTTYSAVIKDYVNCTSGTFTVTFPTAVGVAGQVVAVGNSGSGLITIATTSGQTISGIASAKIKLIAGNSLYAVADGANWQIISLNANYAVQLVNSAGTSFTDNTSLKVPFVSSGTDPYGLFSTDTYTCTVPGRHLVVYAFTFVANAGGTARQGWVNKNGAAAVSGGFTNTLPSGAGAWTNSSSFVLNCAVNDTISVYAYQDSGGGLAIQNPATISISWLGF